MVLQVIPRFMIVFIIFAAQMLPGSTGFIPPSPAPFTALSTSKDSAVADEPIGPPVGQTSKGTLPPTESGELPPPFLASPYASDPPASASPPSILAVPPHTSASSPSVISVSPHASTPLKPEASMLPPSVRAVPPHASAPPPQIQAFSPLPFAPPPPISATPPFSSTRPPPVLAMPQDASPSPPSIFAVPPHASTLPPSIQALPPHASTLPPPIQAVTPQASAPPPLIQAMPPQASETPPPIQALTPPPTSAAPPPIPPMPPPISAPPPLSENPMPPKFSAPPLNLLPMPASVPPSVPFPASPPTSMKALPTGPTASNSVPSQNADIPAAPPLSLPQPSPGPSAHHSAPTLPPTPPIPNTSAPPHSSTPRVPLLEPAQTPAGLPSGATSPASSVESPPPSGLTPLSPPSPTAPVPVSAPPIPVVPSYPNASAPSLTLPRPSPLVPPLPLASPPVMVSQPPKVSVPSSNSRVTSPTSSPYGSAQSPRTPSGVQVPTLAPYMLPLPQNISRPPHVSSPMPPLASAHQPPPGIPLSPAAGRNPPNTSAPPVHVMRQHASAPVIGSLPPQAAPAPKSITPLTSIVGRRDAPSISPLASRNRGQNGHHKPPPAVAAASGFAPIVAPPAFSSTRHSNSALAPVADHKSLGTPPSERYSSPAASPSTSDVKHHQSGSPVRATSDLISPSSVGQKGEPESPQPQRQHATPSPRQSEVNIPSPSAKGSVILAPPPSLIAPSGNSAIPISPPKISPSRSSTRNPKRPLAAAIVALPPPPPNEDCAYLTCSEPLTNTPPGSPCGCVYPMQVRLRFGVDLYTFFPLVLELAKEIAVGVFMKQSQVRIMGANEAIQQPEKTDALIDLVPLGEKFDNTTAFLIFQRFWHKQVAIDKSLFGDYTVLYVHYPGLPPSPPVASSDMAVQPNSGQDASNLDPLGVDVSGQKHKHGLNGGLIAVIILSAAAAVFLCVLTAWLLLVRCRKHGPQRLPNSHAQTSSLTRPSGAAVPSVGSSASLSFESSIAAYTGSAKTFTASEIERATHNFNPANVVGEGGFGLVYSGILEDDSKVAVKVLKRDDQQGGREFLAEVEMLSRLHHRNLVKLIGICVEEHSRCLVYELVPNGSVESHLHGVDKETSPLEWATRMKIALGSARGLAYLHEDSSPRVIHRDFKASNILLENDFSPKVSDFGLARTAMEEESKHISTRVMGTFGYVAPEYAMTGHLLVKSDVYSYGVVLLELLTGRKPVDMSQPPGQENLVAWTRPLLTSREGLESIIDPFLREDVPYNSIAKVAAIASMCVQPEVSHRPFMGEVVQALKLICNECEDTKDEESTSCSHENCSPDYDSRLSPVSGEMMDPSKSEFVVQSYVCGNDPEKGVSVSEIFGAAKRLGRQESGSFRRYSASGPVRDGKGGWFWHKTRRSRGGISDHGILHKFWSGSS